MHLRALIGPSPLLLVAALACAPADSPPPAEDSAAAPAMTAASVEILSPVDGDSVSLPITVTLGATGVEIVPATGVAEPGKGHHHLAIDIDAPADNEVLPAAPTVIHLGTGVSEYVIDSLPPGSHRIIAIFAAGDHVPMTNVARDTVTVIVR